MATAFFKMSRSMRKRSFSRRSREISAAGSGAECGTTAGIGGNAGPAFPLLRLRQLRSIASRGDAERAGDLDQRPTAARQQGNRLSLELISELTPSLGHSTPFRSHQSLAKVSTNAGKSHLSTDSGEITVSDRLIVRMAARLWRLSPAQHTNHVDRARRRIDSGHYGLNDAATVLAADRNSDAP
jgi:hypothetical protein